MCVLNFKEFTEYIKNHIKEQLYDSINPCVKVQEIVKNNGKVMTALEIIEESNPVTPSIYLERYYNEYRVENNLDKILVEIADFFQAHKDDIQISIEDYSSFEIVRDKVVIRLINKEWNSALLKDCPHVEWNDLAVSFRWLAYQNQSGIASALVGNKELDLWGIELNELYQLALKNTETRFPVVLIDMEEAVLNGGSISQADRERLQSDFQKVKETEDYIEMYVLTNEQRVNGASVILYDGVLQFVADQLQNNFYILPSSIHEFIIIADEHKLSAALLKNMVLEANYSVVEKQERLANSVYYYDRFLDQVTVVG